MERTPLRGKMDALALNDTVSHRGGLLRLRLGCIALGRQGSGLIDLCRMVPSPNLVSEKEVWMG